ncbi:lantibiotic dehydratase [Kribbella sp. NPDC056345]|uniref:lantibiotic dehydratase n=1 Tax=Kribbella sp. NPDC056345 TaxID=3345789 RepID=UPI0035DBE298
MLTEAIAVSSASLAASLDRIDDLDRAKLERVLLAVSRYQLRAGGRPTPFGLLAGVTRVTLEDDAKVRIGTAHQRVAHADAGWLHLLVRDLCREPANRQTLRVVVSNLVEVRGDRVVLPYLRKLDAGTTSGRALSIANGAAVQAVLAAAQQPIKYAELHALLLRDIPEATPQHVDTLLGGLIDREILLTDLTGLTLGELADRLDDDRLRPAARQLTAYAEGHGSFGELVTAMRELVPSERPPVQVDLRMDADVVLPAAIADDAARIAEVLWRLAPHGEALPNLKAFHQEFLERYGVDRVVPVRQLLDPHLGLGAPSEYRQPPTERNKIPMPGNPYPAWRDELLGEWVAELDGWELELDDAMIDQLAGEQDDTPPDSLDLCMQVLAESPDAAARGDYLLVCGAGAGAVSAGAMSGRFADMLDLTAELQELVAADQDAPVPFQLEFQPADPRFGNVLRVPRLLPALSVGTFAEGALGIDQVRVGSTGERFYLVAEGIDREITVIRPHMINMATAAPNAARFVAGVALAGRRLWTPWQWGRLDALARLPRVSYGRTVLAPARWRVPRGLTGSGLDRWRTRQQVPDLVRITSGDNHLDLDLRSPIHRRIFEDELKRTRIITESPLEYGGFGVTAGHANELVVPVVARAPRPAVPRTRAWQTTTGKRHRPGGEWISAKVYAQPDSHDGLLAKQVHALLRRLPGGVDSWFFLRYKDPDAHLRLRFHGAEVLPVLNDWAEEAAAAGALRSLVLDEYEPEVARYGGPDAMRPAERLFQADSAAVIGQLQLRAVRRLDLPIETLVAANQADLLASLGDWDWQHWVLNAFPIALSNDVPPAHRKAAMPVIDEPPADVVPLWTPRRAAAREYGELIGIGTNDVQHQAIGAVLHLHANRLLGTDRAAEHRAYGLLRAAVRRQVGRREHR